MRFKLLVVQLPFEWNKKMEELDPKYPVPETVKFAQQQRQQVGFQVLQSPEVEFRV